MPSGFLLDLVDHKQRVSGYMRIAAQILLKWLAECDNILDYPESSEKLDLFDVFDVACKARHDGPLVLPYDHPFFALSTQIRRLINCTTVIYLDNGRDFTIPNWRAFAVSDLFQRAAVHDNSKFSEEEYEPYKRAFPTLQQYAYGSDEFKAALRTIQPAIEHHYRSNDHHPEFFPRGIADMHIIQMIEMTCDWLAASERSQKDILEGLTINQERFGIEPQLATIIKNTIVALQNNRKAPQRNPSIIGRYYK